MKAEQKLYAAVGAVVILAIAAYMVTKDKKEDLAEHTVSAAKDLPAIKVSKEDADKITKLVLKNKDAEAVTLEKKGDQWEVTAPLSAPADQNAIKSVVENIQKLEVKAKIADTADVHEKYELTADAGLHAQVFKGDEKILDMVFGKKGSRGQMAKMAGDDPTVYAVDGFSSFNWAKELKGWRDKTIFEFEDGNVIAAEIENKNGKFSFTKEGEEFNAVFYARKGDDLAAKGKDIDRFDPAKIKDMLRAYKNLKATDFAADGDDTGVDAPMEEGGVIRFTMKDEDAPSKIATVGKKQTGSNRYLVKEGGDTVFVVTSWAADWATAEVEKFQKPEEKDDEEGDDGEGDEDDTAEAPKKKDEKAAKAPKAPKKGGADTKPAKAPAPPPAPAPAPPPAAPKGGE
ncbi:MAG: DUF4340 domain-containing protein [Polyangiaceae bacterium]